MPSSKIIKMSDHESSATFIKDGSMRFLFESFREPAAEKPAPVVLAEVDAAKAELEAVRAETQQMIADAKTRAAQIAAEAAQRGYDEGMEAGLAAAEDSTKEYLERIASLATAAEIDHRATVRQAETELAALAIAIAEKVIRRELKSDPSLVTNLVEAALEKAGNVEAVRIQVNPDDVDLVKGMWVDIKGTVAFGSNWQVTGDDMVPRGGCTVETRSGRIDASIAAQLEQIAQSFQVDQCAQ